MNAITAEFMGYVSLQLKNNPLATSNQFSGTASYSHIRVKWTKVHRLPLLAMGSTGQRNTLTLFRKIVTPHNLAEGQKGKRSLTVIFKKCYLIR